MEGAWYLSSRCRGTTLNPNFLYKIEVGGRKTKNKTKKQTIIEKTAHFARQWFYIGTCSIFFLLLCDVFMWVWLDFYFVEVDRAKLCAATAGPRGNLDWSRLGSFSPEIFCAATLLKRKPHNLTLLTKRKQHKTNTSHTPKNVTYKKRTVWKQEAGSFTWIFSCLWFRKSPNLQNQKHKNRKKIRSLWMSFGYLLDF